VADTCSTPHLHAPSLSQLGPHLAPPHTTRPCARHGSVSSLNSPEPTSECTWPSHGCLHRSPSDTPCGPPAWPHMTRPCARHGSVSSLDSPEPTNECTWPSHGCLHRSTSGTPCSPPAWRTCLLRVHLSRTEAPDIDSPNHSTN
jgi:hypothetical protein